ncbi:unnamed protein product [Chondrus crispus]|uniref:Uncharacterized protein n=1 Tax=Chondrus crispus TaxID=2769 RepID=R7QCK5_CHOCR|nr:unnamed protein product [Chondrus crispus]CDF35161.1 unnamed protein product [Chondrus crispus]|eukprot:XP_005714980.1 unnamed protein product [Chondrus crispus]
MRCGTYNMTHLVAGVSRFNKCPNLGLLRHCCFLVPGETLDQYYT